MVIDGDQERMLCSAAAVAVDAFALRTVLASAVMYVCGRANWWLPSQLDRRLPHLAMEPPADELPARADPRLTALPPPRGGKARVSHGLYASDHERLNADILAFITGRPAQQQPPPRPGSPR